jgi:hypothetical protein
MKSGLCVNDMPPPTPTLMSSWASTPSARSFALHSLHDVTPHLRLSKVHLPNQRYINAFSTSSAVAKATPSPAVASQTGTWQRLKWRIIARVAYYLRIPFLVLSVYGIGYQQGIMDYSREPEITEDRLLDTTLASVGCTSAEEKAKVLIAHEGKWSNSLSKIHSIHQLRRAQDSGNYGDNYRRMVMLQHSSVVGENIVKAARAHVKGKLTEAVKEAKSQLPPEALDDERRLYQALETNEEVDLWTKARRHMERPWRFVLIPSHIPNAFVSEILPHQIFITTSFFETYIESQDELALVLGHEISHLILGHSSARNSLETSIRTLEILLLSLDPTDGLLSLAFMSLLATLRLSIGAIYSRENERSADELGIKLTAMACYDTRAASHVFYKMHMHNIESGRESSSNTSGLGALSSIFDSHPPSEERFRALLEESEEENRQKYEETCCASLKTIFWDAMKPTAPNEES